MLYYDTDTIPHTYPIHTIIPFSLPPQERSISCWLIPEVELQNPPAPHKVATDHVIAV